VDAIGDAELATYVAAWLRPKELAVQDASLLGLGSLDELEQGPKK